MTSNPKTSGQGLVEYSLILVLVAIVFITLLGLLGPEVTKAFCKIAIRNALNNNYPPLTETMNPDQDSIDIDVITSLQDQKRIIDTCWPFVNAWEIDTTDTDGSVENHGNGTFTYSRSENPFIDQDSFKVQYCIDIVCSGYDTVIIEFTSPGALVLDSNKQVILVDPKPQSKGPALDEGILALWEAADEQESSISEGGDLMFEAAVEGLEILAEYGFENGYLSYAEIASQLIQAIRDGNMEAVSSTVALLGTLEFDPPEEIYIASFTNTVPTLADSCTVMFNGVVTQETIDAAFQAVDPEDELVLELLAQAVEIIEYRNSLIYDYLGYISTTTGAFTDALYALGEDALADQIATELAPCSP